MTTPGEPVVADVLLSDGGLAVVRTVRSQDATGLHELHERVSEDALWSRFFSLTRQAGHRYVDKVLSSPGTVALVAEVDGRIAALGTAEPVDDDTYEVAFLVADDHRGRGLGTLLLEHLAAEAWSRGVTRFEARVLRANHRMLQVFRDSGFEVAHQVEGEEEVVRMRTVLTPAILDAADLREFAAEKWSLAPLLAPRSVAVYGARRDGTGVGAAVVSAIQGGGFPGPCVIVHPRCSDLLGLPAYPSASDSGVPVDLAVIAVPADAVIGALEDAVDAGARAAVVISSGFSEMGPRGTALQRELLLRARELGVRLVGPNGLGIICNDPSVRLHATFSGIAPPPGGFALASQSGGVGIALMDLMARADVGLRYFVSLGNKADVSGNDLLAAWYDDDRVTCAGLYLESFGNARKFARFARTFSERKPLLAVVGGRSAGGRRAGASHTAAAASPAEGVRALFAQAGVITCHDAEELADTALLLTREPLPAGSRVGIVSNAGGLGVLAADLAADTQLEVVELSEPLRARLADLVSQTNGTANPVDAGAGAGPEELAAIASTVLGSGEVDAVLAVVVATGSSDVPAALDALAAVRHQHPDRPMIAVPLGDPVRARTDITTFRSSAAALAALGRAVRYADWRGIGPQPPEPADPTTARKARSCARTLLADGGATGWVQPSSARELLDLYGIGLSGRFSTSAADAAGAATTIGFPVAVKLAEPDVVHKTELGLVRTGLMSPTEVSAAVREFETVRGGPCTVLVQPMSAGVEMALGVVRDPSFGPMVMVAAGGIATDAWDDRAFLLPPFHEADVLRVLRNLRVWPLLAGFRGSRPTATGTFAALAVRLGRLSVDVPEVAEIDLNPVLVSPSGCVVVDAKLRLVESALGATDLPSQLRRPV